MTTKLQFPSTATEPPIAAEPGSYGVAPGGYRLPGSTRVGAVRLQVADLDRSLQWYTTILGCRVLAQTSTVAALGVAGGNQPLIELNQLPGATPVARRGRLGLFHFAILLPDRPALGAFLANLIENAVAPGSADHLVSEALYLHDPDGLGIEVYADRPRNSWLRAGRELAMATDPLDQRGLLAAGRDRQWNGMPPGTTMGHVHLHVGDLDLAARFYHQALGLDVMVWNYPGALFLAAGGYHHHLGLNTWAGREATPPAPTEARLLEWELILPTDGDVKQAASAVAGAGTASPDRGGWMVADPWATSLRIRSEPAAQS